MTGKTNQTPAPKSNVPDFSAGAYFAKFTDDPNTVNELEVVTPEKPKEKRKPLKPRDKKFVEIKAKNPDMPNYKAAMLATGATSEKVGSVQAHRMLENVSLREALEDALMEEGFTIRDSAKALVDALQAHKSTQGVVYEKDEEGGSTSTPTLVETDVPDHAIRINAARTILTFLGDKNDADKGGNTFNFIGNNMFVKKGDA